MVKLELTKEQCHALAMQLIAVEGYAQQQERQYMDWALTMPTEDQRERAQRWAEEARADCAEAMTLRDMLYSAIALAMVKGDKGHEDRAV